MTMASYAPIFVNENDQKWKPDMIRFDATHSYGTPSYYVQKLMSQKLGTRNITWTEEGNAMQSEEGKSAQRRVYASASREGNKLYVKLVNSNSENFATMLTTQGYTASGIVLTQMTAESDAAENTAENMYRVVPVEKALSACGTNIQLDIPAYSFNVLEMNLTPGESSNDK